LVRLFSGCSLGNHIATETEQEWGTQRRVMVVGALETLVEAVRPNSTAVKLSLMPTNLIINLWLQD
jgi:hypothetical protein